LFDRRYGYGIRIAARHGESTHAASYQNEGSQGEREQDLGGDTDVLSPEWRLPSLAFVCEVRAPRKPRGAFPSRLLQPNGQGFAGTCAYPGLEVGLTSECDGLGKTWVVKAEFCFTATVEVDRGDENRL
jgi:hypothetical protein